MAEFEAKVYSLKIEEHPNADALEIARVGDYRSIVRKGQYKTGDLGVYIPEQAILPEWLIAKLGLEGKLAGQAKNRVKAVKLRGVLSQGLIYPAIDGHIVLQHGLTLNVHEGAVVTNELGLVKFEPPIPTHMSGEVRQAHGKTLKYDIENIKKYPNVLKIDEPIVITEKIHGTWCCFGYHPDVEHPIVSSKGLSAQGLIFKFNEANKNNLYLRALEGTRDENGFTVIERAREVLKTLFEGIFEGKPFYILGEVFGRGVQDLHYGMMHPQFRAFDVFIGDPTNEMSGYLSDGYKDAFFDETGIIRVPVLYRGPFSKEIVEELTNGTESVSGTNANIREGVVITPMSERMDEELGRVILKSVSESYLLRKNATEFN